MKAVHVRKWERISDNPEWTLTFRVRVHFRAANSLITYADLARNPVKRCCAVIYSRQRILNARRLKLMGYTV